MLATADFSTREYFIAVTEATSDAELMADLSYLANAPGGHLVFDFMHTAANLTQAVASEHIPGHFGFHALDRLIQQLSFIARLVEMPLWYGCSHEISVVFPATSSQLGSFLSDLGVFELIGQWDLVTPETKRVREHDGFRDDDTRRVLIPLTDIRLDGLGLPNTEQMAGIQDRISDCLFDVFDLPDAAQEFTDTVIEVVDGIVGFVRGGLLASLYFPMTGYLELSVMNRTDGAMVATPETQLNALLRRLESMSTTVDKALHRVARHYGTIRLSNGSASVLIGSDGSLATRLEHGGLPSIGIPGPQVTAVLQLPAKGTILWESFARKRVEHMWSTALN